jgi:uncharacterized protein (DUF2384 family)
MPSRTETLPRNVRVGIVGLKAVLHISAHWGLSDAELIAVTDIPENVWQLARREEFNGALSRDQLLRLSAIVGIYKALELYFSEKISSRWVTLPNTGPLFSGARPLDAMISDGLPAIIGVRQYLDDLRYK